MSILLLGLLVLLLVSRVDSYRVQISAVKSGKISNANAINYRTYSRLYDNDKDNVEVTEQTEAAPLPNNGPFGLDFKDPQSYLTVMLSGLIAYNVLDTIYILIKRATSG